VWLLQPRVYYERLSLFRENPHPSDEEIKAYLAGNLCRCSGYEGQLRGIKEFIKWKESRKNAD
jgi:carbon-monoxide dehydrogenase small subunit